MKIGFVFTNYNNAKFTRAAVASISQGKSGDDARIVIVDNGSSPDDVAALKAIEKEFARVHLILNSENVGYFRGLNIGIGFLRKQTSPPLEYIVVGNNDLVFPEDFLPRVQEHVDLFRSHAVVAPDMLTLDGVHQNPHVLFPITRVRKLVWDLYFHSYAVAVAIRHIAKVTRAFSVRRENAASSELHLTPGPIEQGYGACYILGPVFFQNFEKLCAPTFIMQEEFFLTEQLNSVGQMVYYDPRFVVHHHDHATVDALPNRRQWELSQEAHQVYKRYLRLSRKERLSFISSETR